MSSDPAPLTRGLIADTRLWRMALRLAPEHLDVVLYSTVEEGSLIYRRLSLGSGAALSRLKALEEAVYENPLLLSDFDRIYVVVESPTFLVVPESAAADAADCEAMMSTAYPDFAGEVFASPTADARALILCGIEADVAAFLGRTFISPRIAHPLSPLARYFGATSGKGNGAKMLVNLRPDSLDVVVTERSRLLMANTFAYRELSDAIYYILAVRNMLGLDNRTDELFLSGDASRREELMPRLREHVARVAPLIFPSAMFRAGKDAMLAPFDLIVLPLCE